MPITCPQCGRTSYNAGDVLFRYCGACHQFHEDMNMGEARRKAESGIEPPEEMWVMEIGAGIMVGGTKPQYLKSFDPEKNAPSYPCGEAIATYDINEAMKFPSMIAVWEFWKTESKLRPLRPDGKPNRPLTAFNISPQRVPQGVDNRRESRDS